MPLNPLNINQLHTENNLVKSRQGFYFENLDGLRAIAAFSVILFHSSIWFEYPKSDFYNALILTLQLGGHGGFLGVRFFFILSGFLITYLLFKEKLASGSINIQFFYVRRILKIWPLYYLSLFVGFAMYPFICLLFDQPYTESASPLLYSIFAANFDNIYNNHTGYEIAGILGVQWSVSVEEQFYLVWPMLFYFFHRRKIFPMVNVLIIVLCELFYLEANSLEKHYHLISNFRFLSFGGLLAYLSIHRMEWITYILSRIGRFGHLFIYVCCLFLIFFEKGLSELIFFYRYVYHLVPFIFFGFVILEQNFSPNSFFKMGSFKGLSWLGKISYGLYLYHMIAIYIVDHIFSPLSVEFVWVNILSTIILTVAISHVSYTYIELYFLSLKDKLATFLRPSHSSGSR